MALIHWQLQAAALGLSLQDWLLALFKSGLHACCQSHWKRHEQGAAPTASLLLPIGASEWRTMAWIRRDFTEHDQGIDSLGALLMGAMGQYCTPTLTLYAGRLAGKGLKPEQVIHKMQKRAQEHQALPIERRRRIEVRDLASFVEAHETDG